MDAIDLQLIGILQENARTLTAELAARIGLSTATVEERLDRLQRSGIVRSFAAHLDGPAVGLAVTAYVLLTIDRATHDATFQRHIATAPEVLECHRIAGAWTHLVKICARDLAHLETIVTLRLRSAPGIGNIVTMPAMSSPKAWSPLPLPTVRA